jgi:hypothetical protein
MTTNENFANHELSIDELDAIAAGGFSLGGLGNAIGAGARSGYIAGMGCGAAGVTAGAVGGGLLAGMHYFLSSLLED